MVSKDNIFMFFLFFLERNANNKADENTKNVFLSIFIIVQNLVIVESIGIEIK
jgi:hypothetical protein